MIGAREIKVNNKFQGSHFVEISWYFRFWPTRILAINAILLNCLRPNSRMLPPLLNDLSLKMFRINVVDLREKNKFALFS